VLHAAVWRAMDNMRNSWQAVQQRQRVSLQLLRRTLHTMVHGMLQKGVDGMAQNHKAVLRERAEGLAILRRAIQGLLHGVNKVAFDTMAVNYKAALNSQVAFMKLLQRVLQEVLHAAVWRAMDNMRNSWQLYKQRKDRALSKLRPSLWRLFLSERQRLVAAWVHNVQAEAPVNLHRVSAALKRRLDEMTATIMSGTASAAQLEELRPALKQVEDGAKMIESESGRYVVELRKSIRDHNKGINDEIYRICHSVLAAPRRKRKELKAAMVAVDLLRIDTRSS